MDYGKKLDIIGALLGKAPYGGVPQGERLRCIARKAVSFLQWRGERATADTVEALAGMVDRAVTESGLDGLAFEEVALALEWGMRGEYGDYTAVTADNLFRFVRKYAGSDERAEAVERRRTARALPPPAKRDALMENILASYRRSMAEAERQREEARRAAANAW